MIEIKKGKEPDSLLWYRKQDGASYEEMDKDVKNELLESLLKEQGHICAYCMRRIPEGGDLPSGIPKVSIEHWYPRNSTAENSDVEKDEKIDLDYRNMLAVCSGNRGCGNEKSLTCDSRKGNQIIHVNPCDANTLQGIEYSSDGRIKSANQDIDRELNEVLNLNCEGVSLPQNRKSELDELLNKIKRECSGGDFKAYCKKKLSQIQEKPDPKIPYVGILIWWLEKHVRR